MRQWAQKAADGDDYDDVGNIDDDGDDDYCC